MGPLTASPPAGSRRTAAIAPRIGSRTLEEVRGQFPILSRRLNGKPLAYLDNAATAQRPRPVLDAVRRHLEHSQANVHRSLHTLGEEATAAYESARRKAQRFLGAASPAEIVFTHGATEGLNLVAGSWGRAFLKPGDQVLLTEMEHHSNLIPWQLLAAEKGLILSFLPVTDQGELDLTSMEESWSDRLRLVALTHLSNVLGTVNDVRRVIEAAHRRGALVLLDAAQSAPHLRLDVRELDCDFLAFSGHKLYGPMGIGVLYGKERWLERMPPYLGGGEMIRSVWLDHATWNELPYKFEAGTPNVEGAVGLAAAMDFLEGLGRGELAAYEGELAAHALARLVEIEGLTLYGPRCQPRSGVFSFTLAGVHPHDAAQFLDREGIAVRAGHHCAQPLHRRLGVAATLRASLAFYNLPEEVDRLAEALPAAGRFFG
jgi:cysteine desulfurase/selenocysteine lyase